MARGARDPHPGRCVGLIVEDPAKRTSYTSKRGLGGFVRAGWDEVNEIIAAANAYTVKTYGPDRVIGFSPIPAMSMVSYAAGSRYLSLLGGVCMSFYDWYCDLPPASPMTWGEQTDVPESADWYNAGFLMLWGSNVPQTRTPDAHFYTEVRYKGTKSVVVSPGLRRSDQVRRSVAASEARHRRRAGVGDRPCHPAASSIFDRHVPYFEDYCTTLHRPADAGPPGAAGRALRARRLLRAADFAECAGRDQQRGLEDGRARWPIGKPVAPLGSVGFRWGEQGKWNLRAKEMRDGAESRCGCRLAADAPVVVAFPYFGGRAPRRLQGTDHPDVLPRNVPAQRAELAGWRSVWSPQCST